MHDGDEEFGSNIGFGMNDTHVGIKRVLAITCRESFNRKIGG
jgi:hypothetical protein